MEEADEFMTVLADEAVIGARMERVGERDILVPIYKPEVVETVGERAVSSAVSKEN